MSKTYHIARAATMGAAALLVAGSLSAAQELSPLASKRSAEPHKRSTDATLTARQSAATPQTRNQSASSGAALTETKNQEHRLILQVNTSDPAAMTLALNNATNVSQYYKELGEKVKIEVITFGPGLHMLRDDTSPVKARIETMALSTPEVSFKACGNTQENMRKAENKDIPIVPQAQVVKSGVVHVMELEERGWAYVKP
jgi:uncharacterized protein